MKWSINELNKFRLTNNTFDYVSDFHSFITDDLVDLIDISDVSVSGSFQVLEAFEQYLFDVKIQCTLTLACAISLKPVEVPMDFETTLSFATSLVDDSVYLIEGNTVDLDPVVWANILIEKPMRVVASDAYDEYSEEIVTLDEEEKMNQNPFGKLKQ
ncbi:MAG: hypothetical protein CVV56_07830 [Tenericutes bacterium HGW-Tenericutes-1]|jgi:uncharacterized protein|nr:MAG: hypothetical protein CVV56_07830 [Tenericutes bacterium HGW-Tenericutes-1]